MSRIKGHGWFIVVMVLSAAAAIAACSEDGTPDTGLSDGGNDAAADDAGDSSNGDAADAGPSDAPQDSTADASDASSNDAGDGAASCFPSATTMTFGDAGTATRCTFDVPPTVGSETDPTTFPVAVANATTIYVVSTPANATNSTFNRELRRYTRQAVSGCAFTLDSSFVSPASPDFFSSSLGSTGAGDVVALWVTNGSFHVQSFAPLGTNCTISPSSFISYSDIGVTAGGRVLVPGSWSSSSPGDLVDLASCAGVAFPSNAGPAYQYSAGSYGNDLLVGYNDTSIERRTSAGALVWSGGHNGFERIPVRCGASVCSFNVTAGGHVLDASSGATLSAFNMGAIAPGNIAPWGDAQGDRLFLSALRAAPSPSCANKSYFELWNVEGIGK